VNFKLFTVNFKLMIVAAIIVACIISYTYQTRKILLANNDELGGFSSVSALALETLEKNKDLTNSMHPFVYDGIIRVHEERFGRGMYIVTESLSNLESILEIDSGQQERIEKLHSLVAKYNHVSRNFARDIWPKTPGAIPMTEFEVEDDDRFYDLEDINFDYEDTLQIAISHQHEILSEQLKNLEKSNSQTMKINIFLALTAIMVILIFSYIFIQQIQKSITTAISAAENIIQGNFEEEFNARYNDEISVLIQNMDEARKKLKAKFDDEEKLQNQQNRIFEINNSARGGLSTEELTSNILTRLCNAINADVGLFYCTDDGRQLHRTASVGFDVEDEGNRFFAIGEGLVGQCARSGKQNLITGITDEYKKEGTQLATATPRSLLLVPVHYNQNLIGVIEMGAYGEFSADHGEIIETTKENIGIALNASLDSESGSNLLSA
jgi:hypothetical protein